MTATPYKWVLPPLSPTDRAKLEQSIEKHGLWHPIVTCDGIVLDGHNRLEICRSLGIEPVYREMSFGTEKEKMAYIIGANDDRRQLNAAQRIQLQLLKKPVLEAEAKKNQRLSVGRGRKKGLSDLTNLNVRKKMAEGAGVSVGTFAAAEQIITKGTKKDREDMMTGRKKIDRIRKDVARRKHIRDVLRSQAAAAGRKPDYAVHCRSCDTVSVEADMVYTDPPYWTAAMKQDTMRMMAEHISGSLKPDGCACVYWGGMKLPELLSAFGVTDLRYTWMFHARMNGHSLVKKYRVFSTYRQILFFTKPGYKPAASVSDSVATETEEWESKKYHPWGQSEKPALYYIHFLSREGATVYDPFCGAGTFGVAACKLGRRFVGCEVDRKYAAIARKRIGAVRAGDGIDEKWYRRTAGV